MVCSRNYYRSLLLLTSVFSHQVLAAGYEKAVPFSGRYGGTAGASTASVSGAEALVFNPAGLVRESGGGTLSANFSPTFSRWNAPIVGHEKNINSATTTSPFFAVLGSSNFGDDLALGLGVATVGGNNISYQDLDLTPLSSFHEGYNPKYGAKLSILEYGLGAAYQLVPGFRIGAAWRVSDINAEFNSFSRLNLPPGAGSTYQGVVAVGMKVHQINWTGYRVGLQYSEPYDNRWGFGINYRSELRFSNLKGSSDGSYDSAQGHPTAQIKGGDVKAYNNSFPMQLALGTHFEVMPKRMRIYAEYLWTQYSRNKMLSFDGSVHLPDGIGNLQGQKLNLSPLTQNWRDQHQFKVGADYKPLPDYTLRGGYGFTSQVVPASSANGFSSPPSSLHNLTMGAGMDIDSWAINLALDVGFGKGTAAASQYPAGSVSARSVAIHSGVDYRF